MMGPGALIDVISLDMLGEYREDSYKSIQSQLKHWTKLVNKH